MSNISSINPLNYSYSALASGTSITSAAANPAGLVISESIKSQTSGLTQEINNDKSSQNLYSTADGAYKSISDNLQRMRELSVQASNGILSQDDKSIIQNEINQIKDSISGTIKNSEYNGIKILEGEAEDSFGLGKLSLDKLGIKDFNVTGNFSIDDIDNAISSINKQRSEVGASYNGLSYSANYKETVRLNLTNSLSKISDTNYAEEINKLNVQNILNQYKIGMQNIYMGNQKSKLNLFM